TGTCTPSCSTCSTWARWWRGSDPRSRPAPPARRLRRRKRLEAFHAHGLALDEVAAQGHTQPDSRRHALYALHGVEALLHDVLVPPIAGGAGGVARQSEVGQGAQVQVQRPADAEFEHASAPDGRTERGGDVVNAP